MNEWVRSGVKMGKKEYFFKFTFKLFIILLLKNIFAIFNCIFQIIQRIS